MSVFFQIEYFLYLWFLIIDHLSKNMKKKFLFIGTFILFVFMLGCQKEKPLYKYNASFRIDSIKQDSVLFASSYWIKGTVRVYYTVINNDAVDIHCYKYSINALNIDSSFFQIVESHNNVVLKDSVRHDSTKIGVGNCRIARTYFDNILFQ